MRNDFRKLDKSYFFYKRPTKEAFCIYSTNDEYILNGVCPIHLYVNRRPLESNNTYALEYRVNNFQPLTKDPFDRAINGIIEICNSANIQINANDIILKGDYKIKGIDVYNYCTSDLIRAREIDPNSNYRLWCQRYEILEVIK